MPQSMAKWRFDRDSEIAVCLNATDMFLSQADYFPSSE